MLESTIIHLILQYRYALIFALAIFEGPLVMMLSGFLLQLGHFSLLPLYACLIAGDAVADLGWYGVGYYMGPRFVRRFGKYFGITENEIAIAERIFHRRKASILFLSKITMGFGFALVTLITAGMVKIPLKKYIAINFSGQFVWTGMLLFVGYSLGHAYTLVDRVIGRMMVVALFAILFAAFWGFGRAMRIRMAERHRLS